VNRSVISRPKKKPARSYSNGGYNNAYEGKPCPTCYTPMDKLGSSWACAKHGEPTRL
jgi:hypothetical protein